MRRGFARGCRERGNVTQTVQHLIERKTRAFQTGSSIR